MQKNISLIETIRESFGRVVYTHKTHEKMAEILETKRAAATVIEVVSISLTASGLISLNFYNETFIKLSAAFLAFVSLGVALYRAFANLDLKIAENQRTACKLWLVRENYINLISDFSEGRISELEAQTRRNQLQEETHKIYQEAPQTSNCAYKKAQTALKQNEDFTFSTEEIDKFLPSSLKLKKP